MIVEAYKEDQNEVALIQTCYTEHKVISYPPKDFIADMIEMKGTYEQEKEFKLKLEQGYDFETAALMIMMKTFGKEKSWDAFKKIFKGEMST